jgi:hypothetical protein
MLRKTNGSFDIRINFAWTKAVAQYPIDHFFLSGVISLSIGK